MTAPARRHGPLRLERLPGLTPEQRAIALALKQESVRPTMRLRAVGWVVLLSSALSLCVGYYIGRGL